MAIKINGNKLSIDILVDVARNNKKISLSKESVSKIKECRKMVENKISKGEIMYGINTGIGEFSETVLNPNQIKDFQKYLIYNHAAGIGGPAPIDHVRASMLGRINVHAKGMSGCRLVITQTLVEMINKVKEGKPHIVDSLNNNKKAHFSLGGDLSPFATITT